LVVIALAGVLIAPVAHRVLHKFHIRGSQVMSNERVGDAGAQQSVAGAPPASRERS
jgi:hypothetical protein